MLFESIIIELVSRTTVRSINLLSGQISEQFVNFFLPGSKQNTNAVPPTLYEDRRYQQALLTYYQGKASREQQLIENTEFANQIKLVEIAEQRKLSTLQRDLIREFQANSIAVKLNEIQTLWDKDNWFSKLSRQETEQILIQEQQQHHLLILISPPYISADCPDSFHNNLAIEIRNQVKAFLNENYPIDHPFCPVEFYGDYFKEPISDIDVRRLQQLLGNIPTVILYSDITDYQINFNIGFWGVDNSNPSLFPMQPLNWEEMQETLENEGFNERNSLRQIRQAIVTIHQLLAAFFTDWYYLSFDPFYNPKLYDLASQFPHDWVQVYVDVLKDLQQQQREKYEQELKRLLPAKITKASISTLKCIKSIKNSGSVFDCDLNFESQIIASITNHKDITLWKIDNEEISKMAVLEGHPSKVTKLAFDSSGKLLASGDATKNIKVWHLENQQELCSFTHSDYIKNFGITNLVFTPDSENLIACGEDNILKAWSLQTQELILITSQNPEPIKTLVVLSSGKFVVTNNGSEVTVWNIQDLQLVATYLAHFSVVKCLAISPDEDIVASGDYAGYIHIWNFETKETLHILEGHQHWVRSLAFSPDGKLLASGGDDKVIRVWDVETGELLNTLHEHKSLISKVIFTPNGNMLISASWDGSIKLWKCKQ